uniref:UDP glucuronosyltransferase 2 family, polypeptide A7 n=1 Tax=Sinocyclocheilus rhinocerous TaxID=307959 RepID=A0A673HJV3_9TELE
MRLVVWFLSLLTVFGPGECGHWINLKIVLETLIDRGHNVTVLVPDGTLFVKAKESDRFSYQPFNVSISAQAIEDSFEDFLHFSMYEMEQLNLLQIHIKFYQLHLKTAIFLFKSIFHSRVRMCGQIPAPPSFVPGAMSKLTDKMSFTERIINMLFYLSQDAFCIIAWKKLDNYYTEYFGELKEGSGESSLTNQFCHFM